jgi:hypothetical protein
MKRVLFVAALLFGTGSLVTAAAPTAPAVEAEAVVVGTPLARQDGRWLGVTIEGTALKVSFYDAKKKPQAPDVARGSVRLRYAARREEKFVMNVVGNALVTEGRPVPRPWTFTAFLTLLDADGKAVESHTLAFSQ